MVVGLRERILDYENYIFFIRYFGDRIVTVLLDGRCKEG